ncbi:uncharacterized protein LOC127082504 [Lathyrus oleraceus]|uniref:uncharacterized protein LOC127082504 n=1 Tax=Pisum sativum TaxID=3888 RepID=UPI0021CFFC25|nr:uncharacterized protein LOC127082504 [Pisum sativum]
MGEVKNPIAERHENSPSKIITQHSHTSGSEPKDEQNEYAPMEKDAEIQDPREIPEDEFEDGSPETNQDVDDPNNEEEDDQSMFNFDEEPPKDEDGDQNDAGDEERNVQEDQQTPEQPKSNSKTDIANKVTRHSTDTAITLSPAELEALK